jgi:hypothetical protein
MAVVYQVEGVSVIRFDDDRGTCVSSETSRQGLVVDAAGLVRV